MRRVGFGHRDIKMQVKLPTRQEEGRSEVRSRGPGGRERSVAVLSEETTGGLG